MYPGLSDKQSKILDFIKSEITQKGYPPSVREICVAVGLKSTSTVHSHLKKLESTGYIKKDPTKPRTIEVLESRFKNNNKEKNKKNEDTLDIPIVGSVTAGEPIIAVEDIEDYLPLPKKMVKSLDCFLLKIKGESMIEAGILDGDLILVNKTNSAKNGDIVVALLNDNESTVKRFYKEENRIRLQPENSTMEPIYATDVKILGVVKSLIRTYQK
ncbi:transcriptional repressor LexA [Peptostreptococcaceae bacterium AGR-M142]